MKARARGDRCVASQLHLKIAGGCARRCRLITYWPTRSMLTLRISKKFALNTLRIRIEFRKNSRRASPVVG